MKKVQHAQSHPAEEETESWITAKLFPLIGLRPVTDQDHIQQLSRQRDQVLRSIAVLEAQVEYEKKLEEQKKAEEKKP